MSNDMTNADLQNLCAQLGINTKIVTDAFGRSNIYIDAEGMRKLADHAPIGRAAAHAKVDQLLAEVRDSRPEA